MAIKSIDLGRCTRCGICVDVCPNDVLREDEDGLPHIAYREDCTVCFICEEECPEHVITVDPVHTGIVAFPYER